MTPDPFGSTGAEIADAAGPLGCTRAEARAAYRRLHRTGHSALPALEPDPLPIVRVHEEDTTRKFLLRRSDGLEIESVILAQRGSTGRLRHTLCVSSQVGCAMGCRFCATGRLGRLAQLTPGEIVAQWHAARHRLDAPITNVVFMGMGEPTDNLDAVVQALRVLVDHDGPALPARRISISTVGRVAGIRRLLALARTPGFRRLRLAVSINAPDDTVRGELIPVNRADNLDALRGVMDEWASTTGGRVLVEYVLIPSVNAARAHADALAGYLDGLPCTVNVIPYNPVPGNPWRAPTELEVRGFIERIGTRGTFSTRRRTMGRTMEAACGQLGNRA